jgi:hypothetical protein
MGKRRGQRGKPRSSAASGGRFRAGCASCAGGPHAWVAPAVAFVCLLALYVATLAPSVMGGDSGELTASALTGGVPHPPGYPLFAMLARLFAALPLGHSPAWRVNLLSATSTAAAGAVVCATVALWTRERAAGWWRRRSSARIRWSGCTPPRPRCSASTPCSWRSRSALALRRAHAKARRFVFALCFASGLAMCNHHTFVFVGAPWCCDPSGWPGAKLRARGIALGAPSVSSAFCPTPTSRWPRPRRPRCRGATKPPSTAS